MSEAIGDVMARLRGRLEEPAESAAPQVLEAEKIAEEEMAEAGRRALRSSREHCWRVMAMPERARKQLDTLKPTDAVAKAREFLGNDSRSLLVLAGGTGCGKTMAACVALDEYLKPSGWAYTRAGRFVKAIDLVRAGTFDQEFWDEYENTPMLVIDDLGTEPLDEKGWALANLAALIDKRYDACRKTVLTTNLDAARFKARYCNDGGRFADRIREAGSFVEFDSKSMRGVP